MKASTKLNLTTSLLLLVAFLPFSAFAANVVSPPDVTFSITALLDIVIDVVNWFFTLIMIFAVIAVLYGAFLFLTAGGDDSKVTSARSWLLWALVGFGVALLSKGLLTFVCNILGITTCPSPW